MLRDPGRDKACPCLSEGIHGALKRHAAVLIKPGFRHPRLKVPPPAEEQTGRGGRLQELTDGKKQGLDWGSGKPANEVL